MILTPSGSNSGLRDNSGAGGGDEDGSSRTGGLKARTKQQENYLKKAAAAAASLASGGQVNTLAPSPILPTDFPALPSGSVGLDSSAADEPSCMLARTLLRPR